MLAKLISEAFCRQATVKRCEIKKPLLPRAEIDTYNSVVNELQRKYLHKIHEAIAL